MNQKTATAIKKLANEDPQNRARTGAYPRSNVADHIGVYENGDKSLTVRFEFKNTTEKVATRVASDIVRLTGAKLDSVSTYQTGDYQDDWVTVSIEVK